LVGLRTFHTDEDETHKNTLKLNLMIITEVERGRELKVQITINKRIIQKRETRILVFTISIVPMRKDKVKRCGEGKDGKWSISDARAD